MAHTKPTKARLHSPKSSGLAWLLLAMRDIRCPQQWWPRPHFCDPLVVPAI